MDRQDNGRNPAAAGSRTDDVLAFAGSELLARGDRRTVARVLRTALDQGEQRTVVVLDAVTSRTVEFDLRGSADDVVARIDAEDAQAAAVARAAAAAPTDVAGQDQPGPRGPGRPRLGVVAREVTLLPRHWEWLATQSGGASATLRRLVETARKEGADDDRVRLARDATYRFMHVMAGDLPGFEEASRALYAGDRAGFEALVRHWSADVAVHAIELAEPSFVGASEDV